MDNILTDLQDIIAERRSNPEEGSYTAYLFSKGLDKMLKKCGEECSEMIIAAKNRDKAELCGEVADLLYHMAVVMNEQELSVDEVQTLLQERGMKKNNLKNFHSVDKNT